MDDTLQWLSEGGPVGVMFVVAALMGCVFLLTLALDIVLLAISVVIHLCRKSKARKK